MTISDATPHNFTQQGALEEIARALGSASSVHFTLGPEVTPVLAMERAAATVAHALPSVLDGVRDLERVCSEVQAVLTELVDVTARNRAGVYLVGTVEYDGRHVTVAMGDMNRTLPPPEEEPGLYLVHRLAVDIGQYEGDHGGRVTWAAVPCSH
ncbi:hypothetical protein QJ054_33745 [Streptomyces sp. AN-3]|uniref:hypothetical protein n=1 Tax=Streptomyces sp. AN-3 TaxID=3044177 RepID=UPI002499B166|nr:hypothetical protein [Streptomyces sp. AN-3]MDI3102001.1 hypothetical protein [Streptomyces sp. AN-3]MDV6291229.1 hypothetical protein [Streptomyces sp. UP1A-1]